MLFEIEATDHAERSAFFAANPDLRVVAPPSPASTAARIAVLAWSEHCVECSPPACYSSCDLYHERVDGKCRRFTFGIYPNRDLATWLPAAAEIDFKLISHVWSEGNASTMPLWTFRGLETLHRATVSVVRAVHRVLGPVSAGGRILRALYELRKRAVRLLQSRGTSGAEGFLLQVINPYSTTLQLRIEITPTAREPQQPYFQTAIPLAPGFSESWIAREEISPTVDLASPFRISMLLGNVEPRLLYILCATFVEGVRAPLGSASANRGATRGRRIRPLPIASVEKLPATTRRLEKSPKSIKAVIWDLDNTLWSGTLVESGDTPPALRNGVSDLVRALDDRGILQSVVSKNDHDLAWKHVENVGLAEYFLHPRISWSPKSIGIREVIDALNIGAEAVAFIDDQAFERAEVASAIPDVVVLPESAMESMLEDPRFRGSSSEEARYRRHYYRNEHRRISAKAQHGDDYIAFLRSCDMRVEVHAPRDEERERVQELTQRTNQMNFSGTRYQRDDLDRVLASPNVDAWVLRCGDRFGDYGLVGFCALTRDRDEVRMIDLALSCRVQAKHVEHAFLCALMRHYQELGMNRFVAEFRRTDKNSPVGQVFEDLSFHRLADDRDGREQHVRQLDDSITTLDYITVDFEHLSRTGPS